MTRKTSAPAKPVFHIHIPANSPYTAKTAIDRDFNSQKTARAFLRRIGSNVREFVKDFDTNVWSYATPRKTRKTRKTATTPTAEPVAVE